MDIEHVNKAIIDSEGIFDGCFAEWAERRDDLGNAHLEANMIVRLTVNAKVVVLTDVPQGACPNCGSRVYKAEVLERIESLMKGQKVRKVQ